MYPFTPRIRPGRRPSVAIAACRPNRRTAFRRRPIASSNPPNHEAIIVIDNFDGSPCFIRRHRNGCLIFGVESRFRTLNLPGVAPSVVGSSFALIPDALHFVWFSHS